LLGAPAVTGLLSVTGCKITSPKATTKGATETKSQKFPILVDGAIIAAKGHLHIGGSKMKLSLNDQEICVSKATYDDAGNIVSMSDCTLGLPIKRGDYLSMESVYDLKKHAPRKDADGSHAHNIMGGMDLM
jgi:Stress up-regulated Nod 19